jgi:adenylyltransferase/sulfurtransferase
LVPSCAEGGVLGVLPGIIGTIQATEAIKLIIGKGEPLIGRFLIYDALRMRFRELKLRKDPDCPVCGTNPTVTALIDYEQFCGVKSASEAAAVGELITDDMQPRELKERLDRGEPIVIVDVREPRRTRSQRRHRHAVQVGHAERQGDVVPARHRVQKRAKPCGWHPGLDRPGGPDSAEVLMGLGWLGPAERC